MVSSTASECVVKYTCARGLVPLLVSKDWLRNGCGLDHGEGRGLKGRERRHRDSEEESPIGEAGSDEKVSQV